MVVIILVFPINYKELYVLLPASHEEIIHSTLIDSQSNCMQLCFKETSCQSFNIVSSGPREYFCTLTTIHFMDQGVEKVSGHGHRNFSFQVRA